MIFFPNNYLAYNSYMNINFGLNSVLLRCYIHFLVYTTFLLIIYYFKKEIIGFFETVFTLYISFNFLCACLCVYVLRVCSHES